MDDEKMVSAEEAQAVFDAYCVRSDGDSHLLCTMARTVIALHARAERAERERDEARAERDRLARILAVELGCSRYAPPGWGPDELWDDKWSCDRHDVVIRRVQRGRRRSGEHPDVWVAYGPGTKIGPQRDTALECMEAVIAEQAADAAREVPRG